MTTNQELQQFPDPNDKMMREILGPFGVDSAIRSAISMCWTNLPENRKKPQDLEQEVKRLVERALRDFLEDGQRFGFFEDTTNK